MEITRSERSTPQGIHRAMDQSDIIDGEWRMHVFDGKGCCYADNIRMRSSTTELESNTCFHRKNTKMMSDLVTKCTSTFGQD
jgi:hypothetical protein